MPPSRRTDTGAILLQVAVCILAVMGFSAFVIDYGLLMTARGQAQNAADAGALAGAVARAFDEPGPDDPDPAGITVASIENVVNAHHIIGQQTHTATWSWTCPSFFTTSPWCVRVEVFRNGGNGSANLPVIFSQLFGVTEQGVRAVAYAAADYATGSSCLKPWLIPDLWIENLAPATEFNFDDEGGPTDVYEAPGWNESHIGMELVLKEGNPSTNDPIAPGDFFRIEPADTYRDSITGCLITKNIGEWVTIRPGNGVGPTRLGVQELLAANDGNPVTVAVGMFDPEAFERLDRQSGTFDIQITNMMGFRIEQYGPQNQVRGTIVSAVGDLTGGPMIGGGLVKIIQLVQ